MPTTTSETPPPRCANCDDVGETGAVPCTHCGNLLCCCDCVQCRDCEAYYIRSGEGYCERCEGHTQCCSCWECANCNVRYLPISARNMNGSRPCTNCRRCNDCCSCSYCESCERNRHGDSMCGDCERCDGCCECHRSNVDRFTNPLTKYTGVATPDSPLTRLIAVEIEASGVADGDAGESINKAVMKWKGSIVNDGSLEEGGFEINTSPASGDLWTKQLTDICGGLADDGAEVDIKCGLHCHVDASDMNWWGVRRLVQLYHGVEDAMFGIVEPRRKLPPRDGGKHYCAPVGRHYLNALAKPKGTTDLMNKTHSVLYGYTGRDAVRQSRDKYNGARYYALNLHSWLYRGTIEFRMHHGTVVFKDIFNWGLLCASLVNTAVTANHSVIKTWQPGIRGLLELAPTPGCKAWVVKQHNKFNPTNKVVVPSTEAA